MGLGSALRIVPLDTVGASRTSHDVFWFMLSMCFFLPSTVVPNMNCRSRPGMAVPKLYGLSYAALTTNSSWMSPKMKRRQTTTKSQQHFISTYHIGKIQYTYMIIYVYIYYHFWSKMWDVHDPGLFTSSGRQVAVIVDLFDGAWIPLTVVWAQSTHKILSWVLRRKTLWSGQVDLREPFPITGHWWPKSAGKPNKMALDSRVDVDLVHNQTQTFKPIQLNMVILYNMIIFRRQLISPSKWA